MAAVYGLTSTASIVLLGPLVGHFVDTHARYVAVFLLFLCFSYLLFANYCSSFSDLLSFALSLRSLLSFLLSIPFSLFHIICPCSNFCSNHTQWHLLVLYCYHYCDSGSG